MAENDQQIQIRSLSGESTQISIPHNRSIQDLKSLLTLIFPPAKSSPNFHLFFKGVKMSPKSTISDYFIGRDDIIVVVPFTKKNPLNNQSQPFDQVSAPSEASSSSNAADSVWSDLMQDLSFLSERNENTEELHRNVDTHLLDLKVEKKKVDESKNRLVSDIIGSSATDESGFGKIAEVLDSVNCMCDTKSGKCMSARILGCGSGKPCRCPVWLKKLLKTFSFLNIFSGFLEMQSLDVTWDRLSGAMKSLGVFGLEVCIADLKQLSVICPKIVKCNIHGYEPMELGDAIVIVDSSVDVGNQSDLANNIRMVRKQVSTSTVVKAIKKREIIFKENLWWAVGNTLGKRKSGNRMKVFPSLEDLLTLMKDSDMAARCGETKRAKTKDITTSSSQSKQTRCHDMNSLLPVEMVEHLRKGIGSREQIVHVEEISARKAVHVDIPNEVSEPTRSALKRIGISMLYSHQAESIQASLSGKNVVVATMTSSGKSLCYNVPVLESLSQNLSSCALFLFPTKALAQDQIRALSVMTEGMDFSFNIGVYDGDTSQEDRMWLRDNARLLITNPDMLHMSILPFHTQFQRILSNLRFVVIDEAHTYKGAFGCHTALILRRLRRLCGHVYGSEPSFIFCTATSANPREHAMELAGLSELDLIEKDGSPSASKLFVLWNPPLYRKTVLKASDGADTSKTAQVEVRRASPIMEVSSVFAEMVQHGLRCIAFCKTRKLCELVLSYTRDILKETAPTLVDSICSYRAGYTAQDRRRIESEFFGGKLRGVAATNALELGIDVGYIDATLHLGFPGSVSSLWQQAGRSGRRERPSLAVYIAFEGPLDQYFMKFPQKLFSRPIECCHVDAQNKQVLGQHLACAAVEHPLNLFHDEKYFGSGLSNSITSLATKGYLSSDPSRDSLAKIWSYIGHEKRPSHGVSIRAIETEKYKVIDKKTNEVIEEIEESKAFFQVYEGAVYMQQGKTYLVKDLDTIDKIAICEEANPKYYTKTRDYTDIHVLGGDFVYPVTQYASTAQACTCKVTTTWFGFFCFARGSNQICGEAPLSLPKYSYESQAVWIRVPESVKTAVESHNLSFPAGLHAAAHAVLNVVPLFIQCNSSDLASECVNPHQILSANKGNMFRRTVPERILLYDKHPGGSGISAQVQPHFKELVVAALELLVTCQCFGETGCPSCVQILSCGEYNSCLHKDAAIMILKGIVRRE